MRNYIASELLKAAKEITAAGEYWTDMPDRVGKWVKNKSRARRDEKILEYVSLGGKTVLIEEDGDYVKWELLDEDEVIDAGKLGRSPRSIETTLKGLARMYNASELLKAAKEITASGKGPLEHPADWDVRSKWLKEVKHVRPDKISPARAKQLIRDHSSPMKPGYEFGMTQAEYSYVREVWDTLPGTASFDTAMHYIAKGKAASKEITANVVQTIADQMGGARRLKMMLGGKVMAVDSKTLGIKWPNKNRSKGNYVEISLRGDDTYDMEFFNASSTARKSVKNFRGIYNDQLVELFEKQTGWYLRM